MTHLACAAVFYVAAGTIIEVNVSELGLVTPGGKVVWGKYAQGEPLVALQEAAVVG